MYDTDMETASPSSENEDDKEPQEGFTFKWFNLLIGVVLCLSMGNSLLTDDWTFYLYLAIAVIIHEMGHVVMGKTFGCHITEMQVFFLPFVSYKPRTDVEGSSWLDIKWSLGVLPLGGVTMFKSRESRNEDDADADDVDGMETGGREMVFDPATSPYIEDKTAWQRLLISAGGVLFNIATFLIIYYALPSSFFEDSDPLHPLAVLSLILAVLNILPVYPLDGGSIVFALFEIITGKKPSPGFTTVCGWIGFIFIILFFWIFPEWLGGILQSVFRMFY